MQYYSFDFKMHYAILVVIFLHRIEYACICRTISTLRRRLLYQHQVALRMEITWIILVAFCMDLYKTHESYLEGIKFCIFIINVLMKIQWYMLQVERRKKLVASEMHNFLHFFSHLLRNLSEDIRTKYTAYIVW